MLKRMISLMLSLVMVITMLPVQVFSTEEITEPVETEAMILEESEEMVEEPETETENLEEAVPTDPPYTPTEPPCAPTEDPNEDVVSPEEPLPTELPTGPTEDVPVIDPDAIVHLEWTLPYKLKYIVNQETLDTTGCTVTFTYGDDHRETYDITPDMVTGFDNTVMGKQKLVATYNGFEFWFTVTIIEEPKPNHMWFNSENVKSDYLLGESLDLSGGTLQVYYSDGSKSYVPIAAPGVQVTGYDPNLLGQQIVTISYQGLTTEFYVTVSAVSGKCGDKLYFDFDEDTGTLTITGSGAMYDYDWATPWRGYARKILTVELPDGLTSLGNGAFACCSNLTTINLPDSLTTIGDHALEECHSLTRMVIPGSVKYIGVYALCACINLTDLVLPEGIETIDMYAFMGCHALENVVLPESLKHLGGGAFQYCNGLETAQMPETIETIPWHTFIDCTSLKEITIPKTVTEISYYAFAGCTSLETVTFEGSAPRVDAGLFGDCYPFNYVTADAWYPGDDATWTDEAKTSMGGDLNWRTIGSEPSVVEGVCGDNLTWTVDKDAGTLTISGTGDMHDYNVNTSPWYHLRDAIKHLIFEPGVTGIGDYAFFACGNLETVSLMPNVSRIGDGAFGLCRNLQGITLPDGLTTIGYGVFEECNSLTSIRIPEKVTVLEDQTFYACFALRNIELPQTLTRIGWETFGQCESLESIILPFGLTEIPKQAFVGCLSLTSITIPDSVTDIGAYAFEFCTSLSSIKVGKNVANIHRYAFRAGDTLNEIVFTGNAPISDKEFLNNITAIAYYPANDPTWTSDVMQDYGGNITWVPYGEAATSGICGDNLTWTFDKDTGALVISGYGAMYDFNWETRPWNAFEQQILTVELPEKLTSLSENAFGGCHNLTSINLPDGITSISDYAFGECSALSSLTIPDSVKHIGEYALDGCRSLTSLVIPDSVETVEFGAFYGCNGLKEIVLPDSIKELGACAFKYCSALETIKLSESLQIIHYNTFWECTSLKEIDIPESVTEIGYHSFADCTALETITFAGSAPQPAYGEMDPHFAPFRDLTADAWYPGEDATWTDEAKASLGADLNWKPLGSITPATVKIRTSVRAEPSVYATKVATLEVGTQVNIYETTMVDNTEWARIDSGWVRMQYLELDNASEDAGGTWGDNLTWSVDGAGILTISGSGDMLHYTEADYSNGNPMIDGYPWHHHQNVITSIVVEEGVTSLAEIAFHGLENLTSVSLPNTLTTIDGAAFAFCTALEVIKIPEGVSSIGCDVFCGCTAMKEIMFTGNAPTFDPVTFSTVTLTVYYPADNATWTAEVLQNYGGNITWVPYGTAENRLMLNGDPFSGLEIVWIDGVEYAVQQDGENRYIDLPDGNAKIMTAYEYHVGNASDVHTQYPVSMKVWTLENNNGFYTATRQEDFDDILQYTGVSIRVTGKKGIRMITAMEEKKKADLTGSGLAGYTLKEYGTVIAWANQISESRPLVLGKSYVNSNYAYRKDVADPIFRYENGLIHYTNVLVNFSNEQCKNDIAMRPYMILEDQRGNEVTIYGGIVERSIGYIAYMNRNAFKPDTDPYEYIWEIIHYVYGDIYDAEYVPSWTDEIK